MRQSDFIFRILQNHFHKYAKIYLYKQVHENILYNNKKKVETTQISISKEINE